MKVRQEKGPGKGERGWGWVDSLRGPQVGLTLHIPLDGSVSCQCVSVCVNGLIQSGCTMCSKVCGHSSTTGISFNKCWHCTFLPTVVEKFYVPFA